MTLVLSLSGCIPYLAGVIATSRSNSQGRQNCADMGGEWIDGSSWGWSTGKCIMPDEKAKLEKMSPEERCAFFDGTYSNGKCNFTPEQECANQGGIYYASTGACDLRNPDDSAKSNIAINQPQSDKSKDEISLQDCAKLGGIYYASTGACDLRYSNKEAKE